MPDVVLANSAPDVKKEAFNYVLSNISYEEIIQDYYNTDVLKKYIEAGKSIDGQKDDIFTHAKSIHIEEQLRSSFEAHQDRYHESNPIQIEFTGTNSLQINTSYALKQNITEKKMTVENNTIVRFRK